MATLGDATAIRLLANVGANLEAVDNAGNTPLHEAVVSRQAPAAEALLSVGARRDARNADGLSPQDMALQDRYEPTITLFAGK